MAKTAIERPVGGDDSYTRTRDAIERVGETSTVDAGPLELRTLGSFFATSLRLLEAADQTEWHPDRRHYRVFAAAAADLAAAAIELAGEADCLDRAEASARSRESSWSSHLRPRREWTRLVRAEATELAALLSDAPAQRSALAERLQEVVILCIEMMVWLETRGRPSRAPAGRET
jgi:hypothetical protein